jgi:Outer membrane protein beta-barrel domain
MKNIALLLLLGIAPLAHAQSEKGMYFGAGLGSFDYDEGSEGISDSTYAYHLFGGYKFSDNFALELALGGSGDLEETFTDTVPGIGMVTLEVDADATLYSLSLLGMLPFDRMSLFAGVGYFNAGFEGDVNVPGFGGGSYDGGHDHGALVNVGIQHDFGLDLKSFSIRAQYDWYDFPDEIDASGFTLSMLYRF